MRKRFATCLLVLGLAVVGAACSGGDESAQSGGGTGGGSSAEDVDEAGASGGRASPAARKLIGTLGTVGTVPQAGPKVVQTASLRLSVRPGRFDETVDEARSVAAGLGGFVVSSSAAQGGFERLVRGTLVVRVPARSYADAMRALAALGRVEGRRESGQDVSQEYVDLGARARQLEAVESQLLELLDRANTVGAALAVQRQLGQVQLDLERARGRLQYLDDQVAFATVSLELHERLVPPANGDEGAFGVVDAWSKAAHGFLAVVGWTFVVLATAAPLLILLALFGFLGLRLRKRLAHA
jgi:Domain of unknown function (DUF4349)